MFSTLKYAPHILYLVYLGAYLSSVIPPTPEIWTRGAQLRLNYILVLINQVFSRCSRGLDFDRRLLLWWWTKWKSDRLWGGLPRKNCCSFGFCPNEGGGPAQRFGQHFVSSRFSRGADVWLTFWSWCLVEILNINFDQDLCKNLWFDLLC